MSKDVSHSSEAAVADSGDIACEWDPAKAKAILAVIMAGTFLAPLDSSIVNIALPEIAAQLGVRLTAVGWVSSAYLLTNAALILTMGRLGDLWGLRKVYVSGFALFGLFSIWCALAPSLGVLVAGRALQAVGAAMLLAAGPAIIANEFPIGERGRALGMVALSVSFGLMAGPLLGGFLVGSFGWPAIFVVNIPLAFIVSIAAWRVLPADCPIEEPLDLVGSGLGAVSLLSLLLAMSEGERLGWGSVTVLGLFAAAFAFGAAFAAYEGRTDHPMLDFRIFRNWAFTSGVLAATLSYVALFAVTFLMPFYLMRVLGAEPRIAGLVMGATPAVMAFVAPLAGRMSDRWGSRGLATVGILGVAASLWTFSGIAADTSLPYVALLLLGLGLGSSIFQVPNTNGVLSETPRAQRGVGSAIIAEARTLGMALGIAVTGAIVATAGAGDVLASVGALTSSEADVAVRGMAVAFRAAAVVALVAAALSWSRGPEPDRHAAHVGQR